MNIKVATVLFVLLTGFVIVFGLFGPWSPVSDNSLAEKQMSADESQGRPPRGSTAANGMDATSKTGKVSPGARISASGGGDVAGRLASFKTDREREFYINGLVKSFAGMEPLEALDRIRQLPDSNSREMAFLALYGEWSGKSMADIVRGGEAGRFGVAGALGIYMMESGKMTPQQLAAHANEFLSGRELSGVLGRAAASLAATDPATALAMGDSLGGFERGQFLSRFAMGWAQTEPDAAREWAMEIEDPRMRSRVLDRILAAEASNNPELAARNFQNMPADTPQPIRARTAAQIASEWAGRDTLAAMQWASGLPEAERAAAQRSIARVAPVGIGANLTAGSDGVPVIENILPNTPASGTLNAGDRILAVSGGDGGWVSTRSVSTRELSSMIRGEPNTFVSLQVQSPGETSPRVITLGRQQLIYAPPR